MTIFKNANLKSNVNKSLPWVSNKSQNDQEKVNAPKMKLLACTHELNIAKEQDRQLFISKTW